jgi:hypothetical protein
MMRYLTMIKASPTYGPPPPALMEALGALTVDGFRDGYLLDAGGLAPDGVVVRVRAGKVDIVDGPFSEAKEIVGGFSMMDTRSIEEATVLGTRLMQAHAEHWPGWEGQLEIRPVFDQGGPPA